MRSSEKIIPVIETQHFSEKILNEKITAPPFNYLRQGRLFKNCWDLSTKELNYSWQDVKASCYALQRLYKFKKQKLSSWLFKCNLPRSTS